MKIYLCTRVYQIEAENENQAVEVLRESNEMKFLQDECWVEAEPVYYPEAIVRNYNGEDLIPVGDTELEAHSKDHMGDWYDPSITDNAPVPYRWLKDTEGFQIFVNGKWQYAQSIDFDFVD
jgi:hypothetical protein